MMVEVQYELQIISLSSSDTFDATNNELVVRHSTKIQLTVHVRKLLMHVEDVEYCTRSAHSVPDAIAMPGQCCV